MPIRPELDQSKLRPFDPIVMNYNRGISNGGNIPPLCLRCYRAYPSNFTASNSGKPCHAMPCRQATGCALPTVLHICSRDNTIAQDPHHNRPLISIHTPRMGSDHRRKFKIFNLRISIHTPRVGSDRITQPIHLICGYFNPHSPCGE